jgi:hypothetical protein
MYASRFIHVFLPVSSQEKLKTRKSNVFLQPSLRSVSKQQNM